MYFIATKCHQDTDFLFILCAPFNHVTIKMICPCYLSHVFFIFHTFFDTVFHKHNKTVPKRPVCRKVRSSEVLATGIVSTLGTFGERQSKQGNLHNESFSVVVFCIAACCCWRICAVEWSATSGELRHKKMAWLHRMSTNRCSQLHQKRDEKQ